MCGLYGGMSTYLSKGEVDIVAQLGVLAALRGTDSAGLFFGFREKNKVKGQLLTKVDFFSFVRDEKVINAMRKPSPMFIIGHTRAATTGQINTALAHPIRRNNIVGAHNGVIPKLTPSDRQCAVESDSTRFFEILSEEGVHKAVEKSGDNAAIATVFYDSNTRLLNFYHNSKRPLAVALVHQGSTIFWHSEIEALKYVVNRAGMNDPVFLEVPKDKLFSFKVGVIAGPKAFLEGGVDVIPPATYVPFSQISGQSSDSTRPGTTQSGVGNASISSMFGDITRLVTSPNTLADLRESEGEVPDFLKRPSSKEYPVIDLTSSIPPGPSEKISDIMKPNAREDFKLLAPPSPAEQSLKENTAAKRAFLGYIGPSKTVDLTAKEAHAFFNKHVCCMCDTKIKPETHRVVWWNGFDDDPTNFLCIPCSNNEDVKDFERTQAKMGVKITKSIGSPILRYPG